MIKRSSLLIKLLSMCMVLVTLLLISPAVFSINVAAASSEDQVSPLAEETGWFFRVVDGVAQKRLWSYTRGIWLTDWITVGYVE